VATDEPRPEFLGRYRIVDVIGGGAMGIVYKAHDPQIDRAVALKTIRRELLVSQVAGATAVRFRREAMAAGRLSHPGIVSVFDYGEDASTAYIVMELAPGIALSDYLGEGGRLAADEAVGLMEQLLDALGYAHSQGVVHRDIKPSNLLLSAKGRLKITDFGIARIDAGLTRTGTQVGTPVYMAPEMYLGKASDHRADLFSAGVVLYELLTGALPFEGTTLATLAFQVCHAPHRPPSQRVPNLPIGLERVVDRALSKDPDARYPSAQAFGDEMRSALSDPAPVTLGVPGLGMAATEIGPRRGAWDSGMLGRLEAALTNVLGPIAGAVVRRSARRAKSEGELTELLTQVATTSEERTGIVVAIESVIGRPAMGNASRGAPSSGSVSASAPSSGSITADDIEGVTRELTVFVGPIARILVKRTVSSSASFGDLKRRLAEHIVDEGERRRWLERVPSG
jgi:eukaryotic-like serine/threonine-protein kinase